VHAWETIGTSIAVDTLPGVNCCASARNIIASKLDRLISFPTVSACHTRINADVSEIQRLFNAPIASACTEIVEKCVYASIWKCIRDCLLNV